METSRVCLRMRAGILLLYLTLAAISLTHCDAGRSMRQLKGPKHRRNIINKNPKKLKMTKHFDLNPSLVDSTNAQPYSVSSPFSLPPYESLAPIPLPENSPPYCVYPPPSTPSISIPTPTGTGYQSSPPPPPYYYTSPFLPIENPPPSPTTITPGPPGSLPTPTPEIVPSPSSNIPGSPGSVPTPTPEIVPNPPSNIPGSPVPVLNPPVIWPGPPGSTVSPPYFEPTPPFNNPSPAGGGIIPGPPTTIPSPTGGTVPSPTVGTVPSPIVFHPPVVYPPPGVPPPPNTAPSSALWCVAKPSVPDPIIQEAMNYACWSGADCDSINPNGACFEPNTVFAHASYAFNSYWQRTKVAGGTCEFGGTAMLVAVDPSYDGCHFVYN